MKFACNRQNHNNRVRNMKDSVSFSTSRNSKNKHWGFLIIKLPFPLLNLRKAFFFLGFFFVFFLVFFHWFDVTTLAGNSVPHTYFYNTTINNPKTEEHKHIINCKSSNMNITCPPKQTHLISPSNETCPEYFRWIHEDFKIWKKKGITRGMVESLENEAHFRLIIVNGTAYMKPYRKSFHVRDVYSVWGILQLLKLYPGHVPDLDLMFQCDDKPTIMKKHFPGRNSASAPPQFHYCGDKSTYDIVFPDWSFWGWPEVNIKPWVPLVEDLKEGNRIKKWTDKEPYAYWKGNLRMGYRHRLEKCNSIEKWGAQIFHQIWKKESREGYKNSDLSKQCTHRYKIYIEGKAWSVSEKYILACDAMTLRVEPTYYDFFTRSLIPMKHYWPIDRRNLCNSIKFAVDWGNNNTEKAEEIGRAGSEYIFNQIKMEHVYDYMYHALNEYAKLLRYKPTVPEGAVELCSETFSCSPMGLETAYKIETMVAGPSEQGPCILPPPYHPNTLRTLIDENDKVREMVHMWERASG